MGWFSNKDDGFFLATIVPSTSDGGPRGEWTWVVIDAKGAEIGRRKKPKLRPHTRACSRVALLRECCRVDLLLQFSNASVDVSEHQAPHEEAPHVGTDERKNNCENSHESTVAAKAPCAEHGRWYA